MSRFGSFFNATMLRRTFSAVPLSVRLLVVGTVGVALSSAPGPAVAQQSNLHQELETSLREYGWKPEAIAYVLSHASLRDGDADPGDPCHSAVACTTPDGTIYLNQDPSDPARRAYILNHEAIHVMQFARGSGETGVGTVLADVLQLTQDTEHPAAAFAARRALDLTAGYDHEVLGHRDWFHIDHYILEDVGWDVGNLPDWYREAYFPYLTPDPAVRRTSLTAPVGDPQDEPRRLQRAVDTIVNECGPVLAGAYTSQTSLDCSQRPVPWPSVIYAPMPGAAGTGPATSSR